MDIVYLVDIFEINRSSIGDLSFPCMQIDNELSLLHQRETERKNIENITTVLQVRSIGMSIDLFESQLF